MTFSSRDATRIRRFLHARGVDVHPRDAVALELVLLVFFPNHVESVIEQVLDGGNPKTLEGRVQRANEQGWLYFHRPVATILTPREGARRPDAIEIDMEVKRGDPLTLDDYLEQVYREVVTQLLERDMTHDEARLLFVDVMQELRPSLPLLRSGIAICRQNDARSVHYLHGVLLRDAQVTETRVRERERERDAVQPWVPRSVGLPTSDEVSKMENRWSRLVDDVNLIKRDWRG